MNKSFTAILATLCVLLFATWWLLERGNARLRTEFERLQVTESHPQAAAPQPTAAPATTEVGESENPETEEPSEEEEKPIVVPQTVTALALQIGNLFALDASERMNQEADLEVLADALSSLPLVIAGFEVHEDALNEPAGAAEFMSAVIARIAELEPEAAEKLHELILEAKTEAVEQGLVGKKPDDEEAAKEQKARRKAFAKEKHDRILALLPAEKSPAVEEILQMWSVTDSAMKLAQIFGG